MHTKMELNFKIKQGKCLFTRFNSVILKKKDISYKSQIKKYLSLYSNLKPYIYNI